MARTDAVVLGAGIVGTSVALHLVKHYDAVNGTRLAATYTQRITASGEWLEKKVFSK